MYEKSFILLWTKKKHKFHEKIFFRENSQLWPAAQKTQQQKFHTTTFWLLKNLPKKQIIIFGLKSVWVNFNLYYLSFQPFFLVLFSLIAKKWSRKKTHANFWKNKSQNEEKIFFCFLKGVFELLYLNEWDGRVTVTSADIIADNTKTNFMKKQISWNQM